MDLGILIFAELIGWFRLASPSATAAFFLSVAIFVGRWHNFKNVYPCDNNACRQIKKDR